MKASARETVSMNVSLQKRDTREIPLRIVLTYNGAKDIRIYESSLPWEHSYSMTLVAVELDAAGSILPRELPIGDPGPSVVRVSPGQTMTGEIDLARRFSTLHDALKKREVILFWSYQLWPIGSERLKRVGGWLVIPKSKE